MTCSATCELPANTALPPALASSISAASTLVAFGMVKNSKAGELLALALHESLVVKFYNGSNLIALAKKRNHRARNVRT